MEIQVVGVGADVIGAGVSQSLARTNHKVILLDISEQILEHARKEIRQNIRFQRVFS